VKFGVNSGSDGTGCFELPVSQDKGGDNEVNK